MGEPAKRSSEPGDKPATPRLAGVGWARWAWRQLTSMRTALLLLLLLSVAAVPGSTFPQRNIDASRAARWIADNPRAGKVLDSLGVFDVYSSPWFAAIYLLLFTSLAGCVVPRTRLLVRQLRAKPPRVPRRLDRLSTHTQVVLEGDVDEALGLARTVLRGRRYRVHAHDGVSLSSEKGYLREVGNLAFHVALVGVLVGMAAAQLLGWRGDVILPEGKTFANTLSRYDTFKPGAWMDVNALEPWSLTLDRFTAEFERETTGRGQFGAPRDFEAATTFVAPDGTSAERMVRVNGPLETGGGTVYLLGNGYAPVITVRDAAGAVLYSDATPFLAQDNNYTSVGAVKVAGASPKQLGFAGFFLPTGQIDPATGPVSIFPDLLDPQLALTAFEGDLFTGGRPQSVYTLDTATMKPVPGKDGRDQLRILLRPGEVFELPDGRGSIAFDGVKRFAGFSIRTDPGKIVTLVSALVALGGLVLSMVVPRRRVFVRCSPGQAPDTVKVEIGGLAKDDDTAMVEELAAVTAGLGVGQSPSERLDRPRR